MKPLTLSEGQKEKLLEMCKVLFPEYKTIRIEDSPDICHGDHIDCSILLMSKSKTYKPNEIEVAIHWFEMCFTHLSHMIIFNPKNTLFSCNGNHAGMLQAMMSVFYGEEHGIHPVDYLYDDFKNLHP